MHRLLNSQDFRLAILEDGCLHWSDLLWYLSLFLDVGGDSLAGLFSTGSFCLFSYLRPGALLPRCFWLSGHGGPLGPHRSYRGLHR